jgi:hypothetical protein
VCGTRDGFLLFYSINLQLIVRTVPLGERRPIQILITPSWGFVCVYLREVIEGALKHFLALYTINGDPIRETEIPLAITTWTSWSDDHGFDRIGLALADGRCHFFEAFWLVIGEPAHILPSPAVGIGFVNSLQAGILVLASAQVVIVPCNDDTT